VFAGASDGTSMESASRVRADAEAIFRAALDRVDPAAMVERAIKIEASGELVARTELEEIRYDLRNFDRILVAGFGKAGARMALGLENALGGRISGGLVAVKDGHLEKLGTIELVESSHPVPDARSVAAAKAVLGLGDKVDERCLVIVLISGGGSSLLCAPAPGISPADKAEATRLLLASGAPIQEVNCVRKHISAVKGGRLAAALAPATILSLILSDVIGDDLDVIASGPTVPDPTTWSDALDIARRRGIEALLPPSVAGRLRLGAEGCLPDTPKAGDPVFARSRTLLIGTNRLALLAAEAEARNLGYNVLVLTSRLTGEAREAAAILLGIGKDIRASSFPLAAPACLILGGETTVTLKGQGRGGRNQEMALAFLAAMERSPKDAEGILLLAASTDGSDGPTDAAGAFADGAAALAAREAGLESRAFLEENDSYGFFDRIGGLLRTGPTNTNVCDVQILIVPR
jgi:glycerate 2-kinase